MVSNTKIKNLIFKLFLRKWKLISDSSLWYYHFGIQSVLKREHITMINISKNNKISTVIKIIESMSLNYNIKSRDEIDIEGFTLILFRSLEQINVVFNFDKKAYNREFCSNPMIIKDRKYLSLQRRLNNIKKIIDNSFFNIRNSPITIINDKSSSCIICLEEIETFSISTKCCNKLFHIKCFDTFIRNELKTKYYPECFLPCSNYKSGNKYKLKFY